jgi:hypothetical protein
MNSDPVNVPIGYAESFIRYRGDKSHDRRLDK